MSIEEYEQAEIEKYEKEVELRQREESYWAILEEKKEEQKRMNFRRDAEEDYDWENENF